MSPLTSGDSVDRSSASRWSMTVLNRRASSGARSRPAAGTDRNSAALTQSPALAWCRNSCTAARGDAGDTIVGAVS
ncbi:MAG: hypothetical protein EBV77_09635 [Gemmatimonadaceae bacterium]|nr:hypothetical protein [Gemmatimonadaceae bacterium]